MLGPNILVRGAKTRQIRRLGALLIVSTIGGLTPSLAAQAKNKLSTTAGQSAAQAKNQPSTAAGQSAAGATNATSHYLKITINPSTANIIQGAVYGLDAEIENTSNLQITVDLHKIQLAVQPELAPPNISCTWFYDAASNSALPSPMVMQPGDHFTVFFDTGTSSEGGTVSPDCRADFLGRLRRRLDFVPGKYSFVLTGTFSVPATLARSSPGVSPTTPAGTVEASTKPDEHYFTETVSLPVTIDQAQIIIYAGLGGLLAFLVMSFRNASTLSEYAAKVQAASSKPHPKFLIIARQAAAAILVSVTVTVVTSRLTSTSFPVKVSVEDFWGALTVGFVSYFIGGKFIDKLAETLKPGPPAPAPAVPGAPASAAPATAEEARGIEGEGGHP
jgi:hypothetical protein